MRAAPSFFPGGLMQYAKRHRVHKGRSAGKFRSAHRKTHRVNLYHAGRGGIRF